MSESTLIAIITTIWYIYSMEDFKYIVKSKMVRSEQDDIWFENWWYQTQVLPSISNRYCKAVGNN